MRKIAGRTESPRETRSELKAPGEEQIPPRNSSTLESESARDSGWGSSPENSTQERPVIEEGEEIDHGDNSGTVSALTYSQKERKP